ncbi:MAG: hypothetical protein JXA71_13085 [Chitinispirillaceae bacterium]|nr:hypothetical protein [Chitinispirillaceae bacterium]
MRIPVTGLFPLLIFPLALSAGDFSLALEGNVAADLYKTDYFAGISPAFCFRFKEHHEVLVALPLRCRGEAYFRRDYLLHTQFNSIGLDIAWFSALFTGKRTDIFWGPDVYFNYGFPPMTWRTIGSETARQEYSRYLVHSGGITWPVRFDFRFGKRWEVRLTERLFGMQLDARWVEGYSSTIRLEAGLKPMLSPTVAVIAHF